MMLPSVSGHGRSMPESTIGFGRILESSYRCCILLNVRYVMHEAFSKLLIA